MQCLMRIVKGKEFPGIGNRIKQAREDDSRTLTQLAATAGISVSYWNRIENESVKNLPIETIWGIEKALNIDLGVSFDDKSG